MATVTHEFEVCTDCMLTAEGYTPDELGHAPDREPLNLWPAANLVNAAPEGFEPPFSWSPCEGCGSPLGGDRHPMVALDYTLDD